MLGAKGEIRIDTRSISWGGWETTVHACHPRDNLATEFFIFRGRDSRFFFLGTWWNVEFVPLQDKELYCCLWEKRVESVILCSASESRRRKWIVRVEFRIFVANGYITVLAGGNWLILGVDELSFLVRGVNKSEIYGRSEDIRSILSRIGRDTMKMRRLFFSHWGVINLRWDDEVFKEGRKVIRRTVNVMVKNVWSITILFHFEQRWTMVENICIQWCMNENNSE